MNTTPRPGERYLVRKKFINFAGATFRIYGEGGELVAFCRQKAFKLKEDIRVYTDEGRKNELLSLKARSILSVGDVLHGGHSTGERLGSFRRKGMKSTFIRDEWIVFDENETQIGLMQEQGKLAFARHWIEIIATLFPQRFQLSLSDGTPIASYRQHFNPFFLNLGVEVQTEDERLDDLMILAGACLLGAIEGRQR